MIRNVAAGGVLLIALMCAACGSDSSSPSGSSNSIQSITVTATSPLKVGQTAQANGVAVFSGGRTESITSGWRSDAVTVATVTDTGLITGIANGNAVISVTSGGRTGQQTVRVAPDFDGQWSGTYRVATCSETGYVAGEGFCAATLNTSAPVRFSVSQNGLSTSTAFSLGQLAFPTAVAPIDAAGIMTIPDTVLTEMVTITARWTLQQATAGALTGFVHQRWEVPNRSGEGVLDGEIVSVSRAAGPAPPPSFNERRFLTLRGVITEAGIGR